MPISMAFQKIVSYMSHQSGIIVMELVDIKNTRTQVHILYMKERKQIFSQKSCWRITKMPIVK